MSELDEQTEQQTDEEATTEVGADSQNDAEAPESDRDWLSLNNANTWWGGMVLMLVLVLGIGSMNVKNDVSEKGIVTSSIHSVSPQVRLAEANAAYSRAREAQKMAHWEDAVREYQTAITLVPKSPLAYFGLGEVWAKLGEYKFAEQALRETLRLEPEHAQANYRLGTVLLKRGQFQAAADKFKTSIRLDSTHVLSFYNLAEAYENMREWEKAALSYKLGLAIDNKNIRSWKKIARAYELAGKDAEAADASATAARLLFVEQQAS